MSNQKNTTNRTEKEVLFVYRSTKKSLKQIVISLVLTCHSSERGVVEFLRDTFDYVISPATVHNIIKEFSERAKKIQEQEDLSAIQVAALDEIYQGGKPVLEGVCVRSGYAFLTVLENSRDSDTWEFHLVERGEKGLKPHETIADGGPGIRAGQDKALPGTPCFADVFHAFRDFGKVVFFCENRALALLGKDYAHQKKMARSKNITDEFFKEGEEARMKAKQALYVANNLSILYKWFREDVLCRVGPKLEVRYMLFDFIMQELKKLESSDSPRIKKIRCKQENQRNNLLMFAGKNDQDLQALAKKHSIDPLIIRQAYELQARSHASSSYWTEDKRLREKLGSLYRAVLQEVGKIIKNTVRASSIVENLNSRLRNYFFLRKNFGQGSLDLLRFYFNHKRFMRSEHPEHVGKSPAELLSGKSGIHWLEMLGFSLFKQIAA